MPIVSLSVQGRRRAAWDDGLEQVARSSLGETRGRIDREDEGGLRAEGGMGELTGEGANVFQLGPESHLEWRMGARGEGGRGARRTTAMMGKKNVGGKDEETAGNVPAASLPGSVWVGGQRERERERESDREVMVAGSRNGRREKVCWRGPRDGTKGGEEVMPAETGLL